MESPLTQGAAVTFPISCWSKHIAYRQIKRPPMTKSTTPNVGSLLTPVFNRRSIIRLFVLSEVSSCDHGRVALHDLSRRRDLKI